LRGLSAIAELLVTIDKDAVCFLSYFTFQPKFALASRTFQLS